MKFKAVLIFILGIIFCPAVFSQQIIDQVMGIVGSKIILKSDIEKQYMQYIAQQGSGVEQDEGMKCMIMDQLLLQKLMVNQAEIDSVTVSDAQVDGELDRRMRFYIHQIGSEEK